MSTSTISLIAVVAIGEKRQENNYNIETLDKTMHVRIALANVRVGKDSQESLEIALEAIAQAGNLEAAIVCFPESFVPGYRLGNTLVDCNRNSLERAWSAVDQAAREARISVILGTERYEGDRRLISARVTNSDGELLGFQDKVQLDPSEEGVYSPGSERRVFQCGDLTFGIVICHEGWRYPESVRSAARSGAQIVFHPHTELVEGAGVQPSVFADPLNSFHEKAALCRAAENTCYFATVNNAIRGASTTSAVISPDGTLLAHQPYGQHGVLVSDVDLSLATGFLAHRLKLRPPALKIDADI